jgi:hypothetical protein
MTHTAVIDEWPIDDDRRVVIALIHHEGRWRVDGRIWMRAEDGSIHPGKGLALAVKHLERLAGALEKARRGAVARDLIPPPRAEGYQ